MTEAEWLACKDPAPMLEFLRGKASDRKLRLFAVACCRRVWRWMSDQRTRTGVQTAEKFADGSVGSAERDGASEGTAQAWRNFGPWHVYQSTRAAHYSLDTRPDILAMAAQEVVNAKWNYTKDTYSCEGDSPRAQRTISREKAYQAKLIRDIFGNSFCPIAVDLAWLTSTVRSLAEGIYADRAFDRLPILADALQDAGCENADILDHCRSDGPHARGCWVVDLVLGKE
jgi:hypothetical protein